MHTWAPSAVARNWNYAHSENAIREICVLSLTDAGTLVTGPFGANDDNNHNQTVKIWMSEKIELSGCSRWATEHISRREEIFRKARVTAI
jgi:hypothetical protein